MAKPTDPADLVVTSDMTAMIDVVFLMIIFFVCIDFRVLEAKVPAWLPRDRGVDSTLAEPREQLAVRVQVVAPGTPVHAGRAFRDPGPERPARFTLVGHRVGWQVGPRHLADIETVADELRRLAVDPACQVHDPETGGRKLIACLVEALPGTCYDDVARTADACRAAGFTEIQLGGGFGRR